MIQNVSKKKHGQVLILIWITSERISMDQDLSPKLRKWGCWKNY